MDLSKAFDSLPDDLIVFTFQKYGAECWTAEVIKQYLTNRYHRVTLDDKYSMWQKMYQKESLKDQF